MASPAARLAQISTPIKLAIGCVFMAVAAFGYWLAFYSETAKKIEAATRQKAQLQTELVQKQQAYATYLKERDELSVRQQRARDFEKVLPDDIEVTYEFDQSPCCPTTRKRPRSSRRSTKRARQRASTSMGISRSMSSRKPSMRRCP
jgi:hypothetical protein